MKRRLIVVFALAAAVTTPAAADPRGAPRAPRRSAREMYVGARAREQAIRTAWADASRGGSAPVVDVRQVRSVVAAYEDVVRAHPVSGYCDDALWLAGSLAAEAFRRFEQDRDRQLAALCYAWLAREYPKSPFAARADAEGRRLAPSPPAAPARREPAIAPKPATPPRTGTAPATASTTARTVAPAAVRVVPLLPVHTFARLSWRLPRVVPRRATAFAAAPPSPSIVRPAAPTSAIWLLPILPARTFARLSWQMPDVGSVRVAEAATEAARFSDLPAPRRPLPPPDTARPALVAASPFVPPLAAWAVPSTSLRALPYLAPRNPATTRLLQAMANLPGATPAGPGSTPGTALRTTEAAGKTPEAATKSPEAATKTAEAAGGAPEPAGKTPGATPGLLLAPPAVAPTASARSFSMARQLGLGVSRIVIDPGHGGHDPGAEHSGVVEAELVLDIAFRLEALLKRQPGLEVLLTRRSDETVPLEERVLFANRERADLFISIHANAHRDERVQGVETYVLDFASTREAAAVAARENAASSRTMSNLPQIVKAIALTNKLDESREFAAAVDQALVRRLRPVNKTLRDLGVKRAPFVVLIGAEMPSILVEVSFLTNPGEGRLLRGDAYRQRIAEALLDGVQRYQQSLKRTLPATQ